MNDLVPASKVQSLPRSSPLRKVHTWVEDYLAQKDPRLGRPTAVCPHIPGALRDDTIWYALVDGVSDPASIERAVCHYFEVFRQLGNSQNDAIILVFPDVPEDQAEYLIDGVQQRLKATFVEAGMMIGELHPQNRTPSASNPDVFPNQTPVPVLAIRYQVPGSDLKFLRPGDPMLRLRWVLAHAKEAQRRVPPKKRPVWETLESTVERLLDHELAALAESGEPEAASAPESHLCEPDGPPSEL